MTDKIQAHSEQAEYRSQAEEILRRIDLKDEDLKQLIQLSYNECMRLQIMYQQEKNKST